MLGRFLSLSIFLVIAIGLAIHFQVEIPFFSTWMGHLPGDLILRKGKTVLFLPFTTSAVISALISLLTSPFYRKND